MRMRGTCLFCACAQPRSSVFEFEVDVLGGQAMTCVGIHAASSASVYACAGQEKNIQSICMPRKHGCIRQAPLYRPEMEPHGKFAEEGGLKPKPLTG